MKNFLTLLLLVLAKTSFCQTPSNDLSVVTNTKQLAAKPAVKYAVDEEWQERAQNYIMESEYHFKKQPDADQFYAASRKQRLGISLNQLGYKISSAPFLSKKDTANNWQEEILFLGIDKGSKSLLPNTEYNFEQQENALNFNYPNFSIEYTNNEKGLRQNFVVNKKLAGNQNLQVLLKYKGTLTASITNDGIGFSKNAFTKFYYQDLKVWDANKKPLKAKFELREHNIIAIVVEDSTAQYPVTIDPLNQTPEWTGSADGVLPTILTQQAIDAAYGYTVVGVGDVNGDGISDVAIGAPALADIISGSGALASVGAVFIYYGSTSGLPVQPSAKLQPSSILVAGALFGYSIAGGDVDGDGINDVVVGAPLDNITVGGNTNSVGKVYVFKGGATFATSSSTPFLNIQLSGSSIIGSLNINVNALFGFSVAVTEDLNGDGKKDIIVGAPTYAGIKNNFPFANTLDVQSGGAFIFLTDQFTNNLSLVKLEPVKTDLLGSLLSLPLLANNINGLLFGYSVDGLGDYNGDGKPDVVVTAPAGVDLSSVNALLSGNLLQGNATVYYGTGSGINANPGAVLTATSGGLLTNLSGTIANIADLFGESVRGITDSAGVRNGNLIVGAPLGGTVINVASLALKTGTVSVFKKQASSPSGNVIPDQILSSPRNSNTILGVIQSNLLFGYSLDNIRDVNCDGFADIIVGEPASSGAQLIATSAVGGAAYIYFGKGDGTYYSAPYWTLTAQEDALLGVNTTSLIGFSVAGIGKVHGAAHKNYIVVGSPSRTLDFGAGLLNLGSTLGTLFSLTSGDNGVGKGLLFEEDLCSLILLPINTKDLKVNYNNGISHLTWVTVQENNSSHFEIESSIDGVNFTKLGVVAAAGYSSVEKNYAFNDVSPKEGINYYRLKMLDKDGKYVYSNIVFINVLIKESKVTSVYPAPFTSTINVAVASEKSQDIRIELFDDGGKLVSVLTKTVNKGTNNIQLQNLDKLAKGLYIIRVHLGDTIFSQKVVK